MDLFKDPELIISQLHFLIVLVGQIIVLRQSYPENYPYENNPKTGSFKVDLR